MIANSGHSLKLRNKFDDCPTNSVDLGIIRSFVKFAKWKQSETRKKTSH